MAKTKSKAQRNVAVSSSRLVRRTPLPAWNQDEDDDLRNWYGMANGAFHSYSYMAAELNRRYHGGANVRKPGAVCRRDGHVNYGKPWGRSPNVRTQPPARMNTETATPDTDIPRMFGEGGE